MSDLLIQSLKAQARLHHKAGSHGLGKLFDCAVDEIEQLKAQLATAKPELTFETCFHTFIDEIAIRDLEQQAKGLEDYVSKTMDNCHMLHLDENDLHQLLLINLNATALRLRQQAKELKGQTNE